LHSGSPSDAPTCGAELVAISSPKLAKLLSYLCKAIADGEKRLIELFN
jgi:hypothetical protein